MKKIAGYAILEKIAETENHRVYRARAGQESPTVIIKALKAGRTVVTSGPFIEASVAGKGPGETARGVGPKTELRVVIRAAPWVNVAQVEVLQGGRARRVHWARVGRTNKVVRMDRSFEVKVPGKTFFVVVAAGAHGLPNTSADHIVPFAFTNAIWVEP